MGQLTAVPSHSRTICTRKVANFSCDRLRVNANFRKGKTSGAVALRCFQSMWQIENWSNKQQIIFSRIAKNDQKQLGGDLAEKNEAGCLRHY